MVMSYAVLGLHFILFIVNFVGSPTPRLLNFWCFMNYKKSIIKYYIRYTVIVKNNIAKIVP